MFSGQKYGLDWHVYCTDALYQPLHIVEFGKHRQLFNALRHPPYAF